MNADVTFIIFGATGDLAKRRLIPAIYGLVQEHKITNFAIVGTALSPVTADEMMAQARPYVLPFDEEVWHTCCSRARYVPIDVRSSDNFGQLAEYVLQVEKEFDLQGNRLVYCSTASVFFIDITKHLFSSGVIKKGCDGRRGPWHRVVYEKPFGLDTASAHEINAAIAQSLEESQIFRIDHYLAKEIVATIALVRFTNRVFEPLWSHEHIEQVQIVLSETMGMEGRGIYYDGYGALRDVVQNHMLQLLSLVAMEPPSNLSGNQIRDKKAEVLKHISPIDGLLGQYKGYKQEPGVAHDSKTETFAALAVRVQNDRWRDVPFYIRTGKMLHKKEVVICIRFKPVDCSTLTYCPKDPNFLIIRISPDEGFSLELNAKKPGVFDEIVPVTMDYCHDCLYAPRTPQAYELLLHEVIKGEQSISVRADEIEYAWRVIDQMYALKFPLYQYEQGSYGPPELKKFEQQYNMRWRV